MFIKNTWIIKYLICGKQYIAVSTRISVVNGVKHHNPNPAVITMALLYTD
jgi:hypothetical protein